MVVISDTICACRMFAWLCLPLVHCRISPDLQLSINSLMSNGLLSSDGDFTTKIEWLARQVRNLIEISQTKYQINWWEVCIGSPVTSNYLGLTCLHLNSLLVKTRWSDWKSHPFQRRNTLQDKQNNTCEGKSCGLFMWSLKCHLLKTGVFLYCSGLGISNTRLFFPFIAYRNC